MYAHTSKRVSIKNEKKLFLKPTTEPMRESCAIGSLRNQLISYKSTYK